MTQFKAVAEDMYQTLLTKEHQLIELIKAQNKPDDELERTLFAIRVAKDILENRVVFGKTVTITYPQGQLILR
ncbi:MULTISPECIES: hypothetical protein [unclassified Exiguobacterium]|uniref:hypothetical protein n=1 Tax=unclassified Exiguobacterium TaxID=2644629 RepID=UPI000B58F5D2|nr:MULTISPECIES: hypothetical protein [unclassified Exiguobacterium]ASI35610.1 hypothetical protein A0126_08565 [Exiguobacterium sp. N4-1P]